MFVGLWVWNSIATRLLHQSKQRLSAFNSQTKSKYVKLDILHAFATLSLPIPCPSFLKYADKSLSPGLKPSVQLWMVFDPSLADQYNT
jgi:hypothetical protein